MPQANPLFSIEAKTLHDLCQKIAEKAFEEGYQQGHSRQVRDLSKVNLNYATILKAEFAIRKGKAGKAGPAPSSTPKYRPPRPRGR